MIRLHKTNGTVPDTYQVSARRRPRGWVCKTRSLRCVESGGRYEASYDSYMEEGWTPMGLNGVKGEQYPTRLAAVKALVSHMKFRS